MTTLNAYEVAYRAHFMVGLKVDFVRPNHLDHDFEHCPAWPKPNSDHEFTDELAWGYVPE